MYPAPWEMPCTSRFAFVSGHTGALWVPAHLLSYSILALPKRWWNEGGGCLWARQREGKWENVLFLSQEEEENNISEFKQVRKDVCLLYKNVHRYLLWLMGEEGPKPAESSVMVRSLVSFLPWSVTESLKGLFSQVVTKRRAGGKSFASPER